MKLLVVGSGAREHAIVWKLLLSPKVREVYVAPGNAGTGLIARNLDVPVSDLQGIADAALIHGVNLVVVGPEAPLAAGLVDLCQGLGIPAFGPTKAAAQIEASKVFAKELMVKYGIPTAQGQVFDSFAEARTYLEAQPLPVVVKADGLAAGKGVRVAHFREEALEALSDAMERHVFGEAGDRVIIEECLEGREVSLLAFTDGETVLPMVPACDYKRIFDGDEGPNTGGMGSYSPPGFFGPELIELTTETILRPTVRAMAQEGRPYKGVLYAGLMLTAEGPKVLEFNCRFGDPETQAILPRLKTDLLDILLAVVQGTLDQVKLEWSQEACLGVVMASAGYPGNYETGSPITGLDRLEDGILVFHAGTRLASLPPPSGPFAFARRKAMDDLPQVVTDGGRVLTVVASAKNMAAAREKVYRNLERIQFQGCHYRTDIATREIDPSQTMETPPASPASPPAPSPRREPPEPEAQSFLDLARSLLREGRMGEGLQQLQRALRLQPKFVEAHAALADLHARQGRLDLALEGWQRVVALAPEDAEAHHNLGSLYLRRGRPDLARRELEEALRVAPHYLPAYLGLGALLSHSGEVERAIQCYERALEIDPKSSEAHLDLALALEAMGEKERAIVELEACLALDPDPATRQEVEERLRKLRRKGWFQR